MVGFHYDDHGIDNGLESVSENTRERVFERDGERCLLCEESYQKGLDISHQIEAAEEEAFARFKTDGTLPDTVTDPSHKDNLFPLCSSCHRA